MTDTFTVHIVDDDAAVRSALALLLGVHGVRTQVFGDAEGFLNAVRADWSGCVLLDIRMPGMDGLALQRALRERAIELPVIIMTGHGDVASAREAFRVQAIDFLEKPIEQARLLQAISEARGIARNQEEQRHSQNQLQRKLSSLTARETEVMQRVVAGAHNRDIAAELGISPRTVEVHKARMMDKLSVDSVAELVRLSLSATPR